MTRLHHFLPLALAALCAAPPALAQKQMAPGLWEHTVTMKVQGGGAEAAMAQMQERLAAMPPDKRKQIEDMMARQGGMGMAAMGGKPSSIRVCITPEQAARDEMPQNQGNCQQTSKERSGNTLKFKFTCSGERAVSGEGEYTFISDKAHTGHVVLQATMRGQPGTMDMDTSGRWLGADCGDVKPRGK